MRVRWLALFIPLVVGHAGMVMEVCGPGGPAGATAFGQTPMLASSVTSTPASVRPRKQSGTLVMAGGALRFNNQAVWSRIVEAAAQCARRGSHRGERPRIAVFATASADAQQTGNRIVTVLQNYGATAFIAPVVWGTVEASTAVLDPRVVAQVESAQGVFFSGGQQSRLVDALRTPDGRPTPVLDAVRRVYAAGGVVAGTSAGAAVMSRIMCRDAGNVLSVLKRGVTKGKEVDEGFGLLDAKWFVDQHFFARGRFARALVIMHQFGLPYGLGIDEDTAVVVHSGQAELVGYRGALLIDLSRAKPEAQAGGFNLADVRISYLDRGDRLDLATRELRPSAEKRAEERINPSSASFRPAYNEPIFANDILSNSALLEIMKRLMDNAQSEALGLAYDAKEALTGPCQGFEFRISRTAGTVAWLTGASGSQDWTIGDLRLDVRPVTIRGPSYK